jgi:hypothetical protein
MSIPNNIIQYKSCFNFSDISNNPYVFFLEALSFSNKKLWEDSFKYDISNNKIICNHKYLSKLLFNLNKILKGNLNIYGHSFSKNDLVLGNLYLYYIQFISNYLFGHPEAYEPFKNDDIIKKALTQSIESISDSFYEENVLFKFMKKNFLVQRKLTFNHLDIVEFQIIIPDTPIFFGKEKITIPKTFWNIKLLITE